MTAAAQPSRTPEWTLADRLRKVRRDVADAGQREFAQQLGVAWQTYASWEAGGRPKDIVALARRIELMCGVPAAWTLGVDAPVVTPAVPAVTEGADISAARSRWKSGSNVIPLRRPA